MSSRFIAAATNPLRLHQELVERVGAEMADSNRSKVQLAFDVEIETIYREATSTRVEGALPSAAGAKADRHPAQWCAYSGATEGLQTEPFPKVFLPVLNKAFPLLSMFSEAACNQRYGLTDAFSVPVTTSVALQMWKVLEAIVAKEREGKTWRGVASGHYEKSKGQPREKFDLLVAYVDGQVSLPAAVASLFGAGRDSEARQFEADASAVCDALDAIFQRVPLSHLNLFLLRRISEGQVQVQLDRSPAVQDVIRGAQDWLAGAANIPAVGLRMPVKGASPLWVSPRAPHPDQLIRVTSRQWVGDGSRWTPSRGASLGQVVDVLLRGPGWHTTALELLDLSTNRTWPLLIGLFGSPMGRDDRRFDEYPRAARQHALLAASTLGILLDALGFRKESYMKSAPFLVGQLLQLADVLHREHSRVERGSLPPPQMIGNALMAVARGNPQAAVDRLGERILIYKAWADKSGGDARLARWAVHQMRRVGNDLAETTLPTSADEADRAQLLLGYIATVSNPGSQEEPANLTPGGNHDPE